MKIPPSLIFGLLAFFHFSLAAQTPLPGTAAEPLSAPASPEETRIATPVTVAPEQPPPPPESPPAPTDSPAQPSTQPKAPASSSATGHPAAPTEAPPEAHRNQPVIDTTRLLKPATIQTLQQEIQAFTQETGCFLGIHALTYVEPGISARLTARDHRKMQCPPGPASLILVERAKDSIMISLSPDLWARYPTPGIIETMRQTLDAMQKGNLSLEEKVLIGSRTWMTGLRTLENQRLLAKKLLQPHETSLLILFILLFFSSAILIHWLSKRQHRRRVDALTQYHFIEVPVNARLGAPYGGGVILQIPDNP